MLSTLSRLSTNKEIEGAPVLSGLPGPKVALAPPFLREAPAGYSSFKGRDLVYEIALRTPPGNPWLRDLPNSYRLLQTWLLAQSKGWCGLLDFVIKPEGFLLRVHLGKQATLAEFLVFVRERSTPPHQTVEESWVSEPAWLKLVPPSEAVESSREFMEKAAVLREEAAATPVSSPQLYFFFHDPKV